METKTEIDKDLIDIFKTLYQQNTSWIEKHGDMSPIFFFIKKDGGLDMMLLVMRNSTERDIFKQLIKKKALNSEIKGYVMIMDAKITSFDRSKEDNSNAKVQDAVISQLFTPRGRMSHILIHEGKKIIKEDLCLDYDKIKSEWDIWGKGMDMEIKEERDIAEWYKIYKNKNRDKYKGCK